MTIAPLLWPIVLCLVVISSATALLLATTLLERLIVLPALDHHTPVRQRADVHINGKGR
jgi:hypothetical protein